MLKVSTRGNFEAGLVVDGAWQRRVEVTIDVETGLRAQFISGADLIAAKLAVGRPQDLADVSALNKPEGRKQARKPKRAKAGGKLTHP